MAIQTGYAPGFSRPAFNLSRQPCGERTTNLIRPRAQPALRLTTPLPLARRVRAFLFGDHMPFDMTDDELRRWLLVLHQLLGMRATMRMRPAP